MEKKTGIQKGHVSCRDDHSVSDRAEVIIYPAYNSQNHSLEAAWLLQNGDERGDESVQYSVHYYSYYFVEKKLREEKWRWSGCHSAQAPQNTGCRRYICLDQSFLFYFPTCPGFMEWTNTSVDRASPRRKSNLDCMPGCEEAASSSWLQERAPAMAVCLCEVLPNLLSTGEHRRCCSSAETVGFMKVIIQDNEIRLQQDTKNYFIN